MEQLLLSLKKDFPRLHFVAGPSFCWSPATQEIYYIAGDKEPSATWSLLHEIAHAALNHNNYSIDFELIEIEVAAWQKAKELAQRYDVTIDKDHIENCLDSYRDWLHRRSICPSCGTQALQLDGDAEYRCFNCQASWHVTPSRFCRPYRQSLSNTKSPVGFATTGDSLLI